MPVTATASNQTATTKVTSTSTTSTATSVYPKKTLEEVYDFPWKLAIELELVQNEDTKPKISFMSGKDREYYPEHPGHSRHGVEYSMNCHPGDVPNPNYLPSDDKLQKPISLLGYGIGGLSAPRFKTDKPLNKSKQNKSKTGLKPKKKLEKTLSRAKSVVESMAEGPKIFTHRRSMVPEPDAETRKPSKDDLESLLELKQRKSLSAEQCENLRRQKMVAFFGSTRTPRFVKMEDFGVGVGHYNTDAKNLCIKAPVEASFGSAPTSLKEMTKMICNYEGYDQCLECQLTLIKTDYYRSIRPISIPHDYFHLYSSHSEFNQPQTTTAFSARSKSIVTLSISSSMPLLQVNKMKMCPKKYIAMCRKCYCDLINFGHGFWTKERLVLEFEKARHCVHIHEHNNMPVTIHKVPCKLTRRLKRMEAVMNKYFPDFVEKVVRQTTSDVQPTEKKVLTG